MQIGLNMVERDAAASGPGTSHANRGAMIAAAMMDAMAPPAMPSSLKSSIRMFLEGAPDPHEAYAQRIFRSVLYRVIRPGEMEHPDATGLGMLRSAMVEVCEAFREGPKSGDRRLGHYLTPYEIRILCRAIQIHRLPIELKETRPNGELVLRWPNAAPRDAAASAMSRAIPSPRRPVSAGRSKRARGR